MSAALGRMVRLKTEAGFHAFSLSRLVYLQVAGERIDFALDNGTTVTTEFPDADAAFQYATRLADELDRMAAIDEIGRGWHAGDDGSERP